MMRPIILSDIVDHDLCIGCGVCAAICPDDVLSIQFNRFGEYNPVDIKDCLKECGLCSKVCPFSDGNPDEDTIGERLFGKEIEIQHRPETGFFLETYVGHSKIGGHRENGSSGGMATWLLQTLLEEETIDRVVCVTANPDPGKLFRFVVFSTIDEVTRSSGSVYYPVELSDVMRYIMEHPGRYAVIGLPCFVKAVRLAQKRNRHLRERIVVVLGLTCGQLKGKYYTAYLAAIAGLKEAPTRVYYRGKDPEQSAANFYFSCSGSGGEEHRVYWSGGVSEAWVNRWFTPNACNFCDDIFAECADVTFMDGWLPNYSMDYRGTNFLIVRSDIVNKALQGGIENGSLDANTITVDEVIRSQAGVIAVKRAQLADRLYRAHKLGNRTPIKRVKGRPIQNPLVKREIVIKEEMQQMSRKNLPAASRSDVLDSDDMRRSMKKQLDRIGLLRKLSAGLTFPVQGVRYLRRRIHGR